MVEFHEIDSDDGTRVLSVAGEFDLAVVDDFLERAMACLDRAEGIDVDLGGVTFIDSSGLGALVRVRKEAGARGKTLTLVHVSAPTHRLLEITGLQQAFEIRPDED